MPRELVDAYDGSLNPVGVVERNEAHLKGILHKTVHCWFIDGDFAYFQIRGKRVGFPGMLDATVGGHISSAESTGMAILRELNEEVGLVKTPADLKFVGNNRFHYEGDRLCVNEFSDVYFIAAKEGLETFFPSENELTGIAAVPFVTGREVLLGIRKEIDVRIMAIENGTRKYAHRTITGRSFVPGNAGYFSRVLEIGKLHASGHESVSL